MQNMIRQPIVANHEFLAGEKVSLYRLYKIIPMSIGIISDPVNQFYSNRGFFSPCSVAVAHTFIPKLKKIFKTKGKVSMRSNHHVQNCFCFFHPFSVFFFTSEPIGIIKGPI